MVAERWIFDEFGQLKFNVRNRLLNPRKQTKPVGAPLEFRRAGGV